MSNTDDRMETFLKIFLIAYYLLFLLFAMVLPTYRVWKATGVNPYKLGNSDSAHDYIGKNFRLVLIASALLILIYVFFPALYQQFFPISYLTSDAFTWMGIALLFVVLVWVLVAQANMQTSWRQERSSFRRRCAWRRNFSRARMELPISRIENKSAAGSRKRNAR